MTDEKPEKIYQCMHCLCINTEKLKSGKRKCQFCENIFEEDECLEVRGGIKDERKKF